MDSQTLSEFKSQILKTYNSALFADKVVLVTGASRGIGRACAVAFGALGAKVIINYAGNEAAAHETASFVEAVGGTPKIACFDVSHFDLVQSTIKTLETDFGTIDILINNAGISKDNLFVRFKEEDWDKTLNINLKGSFNCARAVAMSMMRKKQGKIINISSVIGLTGNAGQAAYAASKAGVIGLSKSLALEFASRNMQINTICPGYISTDMTNHVGEKLIESVLTKIPAQRLGEPIDVALACLFIASPASHYITGQTICVDGGMVMP